VRGEGESESERPRHCVRADLAMVAVASAGGHRRHPRPPDRGLCSSLLHPSFPFHYSDDRDYCGPAVYCLSVACRLRAPAVAPPADGLIDTYT
jgi:hypothetical protein